MIKAFSEVFTPEVRDEAQRLFASGRVEVLAIEDTFLTTSVKDVTTERVVIKRRADRFQISCTCPDGKSGACSHVLASMLAARGQAMRRGCRFRAGWPKQSARAVISNPAGSA